MQITEIGQSNTIAIMNSDPNSDDSDGDGVLDAEDGRPWVVNRMINYLVVGQDRPGESPIDDCADYYEELLKKKHMPRYRLEISTGNEFYYLWSRLDSYHGDLESEELLPRYSIVDNLIIVCHGSSEILDFGQTALSNKMIHDDDLNIDFNDPMILGDYQKIHINVIDLQACNCANEDSEYGKYNIAHELCANLDVETVYAWDTECKFSTLLDMNYYEDSDSDGYVKYTKTSSEPNRVPNVDEHRTILLFFVSWCYNPVTPKIHSLLSSEG